MNDDNIYSGGLPEEIDYTPNTQRDTGPSGIAAPVLDDIEYSAPAAKKGGPTGVSAPVLDDMDVYTPNTAKKGAPTGVSAPILDDNAAPYSAAPKKEEHKLVMSDEDIIAGFTPEQLETFNKLPAENQQKVIDMRRTQLGASAPEPELKAPVLDDPGYIPPPKNDFDQPAAVTAPVLDEDNYTPPPKAEKTAEPAAPITAPILDDEPEAPKYVPKFVDEDLENAKKDARKAVASSLSSDQKDPKESLRMQLQLKEERRQERAQKGFYISMILAVVGVIAAAAFYLLYSGKLGLDYKNVDGAAKVIKNISLYCSIAAGVCSVGFITGLPMFHSLGSLVFLALSIIQLVPGSFLIPQHEGSMGLVILLYAAALICSIAVFATLAGSECLGEYFKKNKN